MLADTYIITIFSFGLPEEIAYCGREAAAYVCVHIYTFGCVCVCVFALGVYLPVASVLFVCLCTGGLPPSCFRLICVSLYWGFTFQLLPSNLCVCVFH